MASGIAVAGAGLLLGPSLPRSASALFLPLLSAASFSLYVVMTRMLRGESVLTNLFYTGLGVFAALTPIVATSWVTPTRHDLVVLASIGLLGLGALYALDRMASAAAVSSSAPVVALQVAFTIGAGAMLTERIPGIHAWGGACLVGGAALWSWTRGNATTVVMAKP
jgi:drug/metabolite transporter (DMT)-like permease